MRDRHSFKKYTGDPGYLQQLCAGWRVGDRQELVLQGLWNFAPSRAPPSFLWAGCRLTIDPMISHSVKTETQHRELEITQLIYSTSGGASKGKKHETNTC